MESDDGESYRDRKAVKTIDIVENRLKETNNSMIEELEKEESENLEPLSIRGRIMYWILRGLQVLYRISISHNSIVTICTGATGDNYLILVKDRVRKRRADVGVQNMNTNDHP